jgi:hypothetical protein
MMTPVVCALPPAYRVGHTRVVLQAERSLRLSYLIPLYPSIPICLSVIRETLRDARSLLAPALRPSFDDGRRVGWQSKLARRPPAHNVLAFWAPSRKLTSDYPKSHPLRCVTRARRFEIGGPLFIPIAHNTKSLARNHKSLYLTLRARNAISVNLPDETAPCAFQTRCLKPEDGIRACFNAWAT